MEEASFATYLFRPAQLLGIPSVVAPSESGKISVSLQFIIPGFHISKAEKQKYNELIKKCHVGVWGSDIQNVKNNETGASATLVTIAYYIDKPGDDSERNQIIQNMSRLLIERFLGVVSYCAGTKLHGKNIVNTIIEGSNFKAILNAIGRTQSPKIEFDLPQDLIDNIPSDRIFTALFWLRRGLAESDPIDTYNAFMVCLQIIARDWWEKKNPGVEIPGPTFLFKEFITTALGGSWVNVTENHRENRMHRIHFGIKHPLSHLLALFSSSRTRPLGEDLDLVEKAWKKRNAIGAHGNKLNINSDDFIGLTELKFEAAKWAYKGINLALGLDLENAPKPSQNFFVTAALMNLD
jgi:hypothetical protein